MDTNKSLTMNGINGKNFLYILNSVGMIATCIYLTTHFYDTLYPTQLGGASTLCNLSNFFNCDAATHSKLSNILGVPIAFFGLIMSLLFLFSSLMPSENLEKTASALSKYNLIGCLSLFIYSFGALGSLCPFCTLYYALSGIACFLLWKFGANSWTPDIKTTGLWGILLLGGSAFMYQHTSSKEDVKSKLNVSVVEQYRKLGELGDPTTESPYKIHMSTAKFADAPLRLTIFSDFECPFCKVVADQMPELIRLYKDKINIQYFFYPLDAKCNSNVKGRFHEHACDAAYLAACDAGKFLTVHDDIFAAQEKLKSGALDGIMKKNALESCLQNESIKGKIVEMINAATQFNLKSTPTIILNGKKIEGTIPSTQFFAIFEDILSQSK